LANNKAPPQTIAGKITKTTFPFGVDDLGVTNNCGSQLVLLQQSCQSADEVALWFKTILPIIILL